MDSILDGLVRELGWIRPVRVTNILNIPVSLDLNLDLDGSLQAKLKNEEESVLQCSNMFYNKDTDYLKDISTYTGFNLIRRMSAEPTNQIEGRGACINLESVNRISKLPVVETTIETGKHIYEKVKDYNSVTNWTISTAENTVCKAVEVGKPYAAPVVHSLEGPIKKVDSMICNGLDYVEAKLPSVKLPPSEMYNSTKDYLANSPTVMTACALAKPAVDTAKTYVEPAMETAKSTIEGAKSMVEPALETAKMMVDPAVQTAKNLAEPYMQKAQAIRDYGTQKVEEFLHTTIPEEVETSDVECVDCQGDNPTHQHHDKHQ